MSLLTHNPAVSPAVPKAIDSDNVRLSGFFITQSFGTLTNSENPPAVFIPKSYPVTITSSPSENSATEDDFTIPATSIPGVWG